MERDIVCGDELPSPFPLDASHALLFPDRSGRRAQRRVRWERRERGPTWVLTPEEGPVFLRERGVSWGLFLGGLRGGGWFLPVLVC